MKKFKKNIIDNFFSEIKRGNVFTLVEKSGHDPSVLKYCDNIIKI